MGGVGEMDGRGRGGEWRGLEPSLTHVWPRGLIQMYKELK